MAASRLPPSVRTWSTWCPTMGRKFFHYHIWVAGLALCVLVFMFYSVRVFLMPEDPQEAGYYSLASIDSTYLGNPEQHTLFMSHLAWFKGQPRSYSIFSSVRPYFHRNMSFPATNDMRQVLHNLGIDTVAMVGPFDLPLYGIAPSLRAAGIKFSTYTCEEVASDTIPDRSLVVIGNCAPVSDAESFDKIYHFYDDIRRSINAVREHRPNALIAWVFPVVAKFVLNSELRMYHEHLIIRHLIEADGVLVMFPQVIAEKKSILPRLLERARDSLTTRTWQTFAKQLSKLDASGYQLVRPRQRLSTQLVAHCAGLVNTRKYAPACMPKPKSLKPLLVTGLGGAGTHSISAGLAKLGIDAAHETMSAHGSVCWFYAANDKIVGLPYPHHAFIPDSTHISPRFQRVYHVTRCPLKQISAFTTHLPASYDFVRNAIKLSSDPFFMRRLYVVEHTGVQCKRGGKCHFYLAAVAWLFWNRHVETYADKRVRIEDSPWSMICEETFGADQCKPKNGRRSLTESKNATLPKKLLQNRRDHLDFHLSDVAAMDKELAVEIEALARRYGYGDDCL